MITSTLIDGPIEVLTKHDRIFPAPLSSLPVTLSQTATALEVKSSIPCSLDPTAVWNVTLSLERTMAVSFSPAARADGSREGEPVLASFL